jgi:hypothetical protein
MKKLTMGLILALLVSVMVFGAVLAAPGGQPGAHDLDGRDFGAAVSANAPIADHVSNAGGNGNGMPAAHDLDGRDFGAAVSANAPIADHVSNK